MTTIPRFDPFRELQQLRRLPHRPFFAPAFRGRPLEPADAPPAAWSIPMDVQRDDCCLTVNAALPGFAPDDVEVSISPDRVLSVKASRAAEATRENAEFLMRERRAGRFARAIRLPGGLDLDAAAVNLEHGVLTVTLPVAETAQTRKLSINAAAANPDTGTDTGADAGTDADTSADADAATGANANANAG